MLLWKGATLLYHGTTALRFKPSEPFATLFDGQVAVIHASIVWFAIFAVIFYFLLHHHRLGNHFFAVGGNRNAAVAIGDQSQPDEDDRLCDRRLHGGFLGRRSGDPGRLDSARRRPRDGVAVDRGLRDRRRRR